MKKLSVFLSVCFIFFLAFSHKTQAQIAATRTESYTASFEKKINIDSLMDYEGPKIPIQLLSLGINEDVYAAYPELKDKRVGLGVTNIVIEYLEYTNRFIFTEEKEDIKQRMIAQDKASDKGVSSNKIEVKGNVVLAKYFVYIEVYDFSVSEDEVVKVNGQQTVNQTTRLGLQIKFVDAETSQVIVGSGLGEAVTIKTTSILGDISDDVKFNQSTVGISTKKALETASSRVVTRLISKGVFPK